MGRLEKIVVLAVLLLVAVVLGVALNTEDPRLLAGGGPLGDPDGGPAGPALTRGTGFETPPLGTGEQEVDAQHSPAGAGMRDPELLEPRRSPGGLLEAAIQTPTEPTQPAAGPPLASGSAVSQAPSSREASGLASREGLTATLVEDLMQYTWQAGDDFAALAERFYGSRDRAALLCSANEGLREADMQPGTRIWVPTGAAPAALEPPAVQWEAGELYVVQPGDILGRISQTVYGTSQGWRKIFNANRDILSDPDALRAGMKLRIPE